MLKVALSAHTCISENFSLVLFYRPRGDHPQKIGHRFYLRLSRRRSRNCRFSSSSVGPMKPWIQKIPLPRISAAGLLGPDLVLSSGAVLHQISSVHDRRAAHRRRGDDVWLLLVVRHDGGMLGMVAW